MSNAYDQLISKLTEGEFVEAILFGEYGWGLDGPLGDLKSKGLLSLEEATPFLKQLSFEGGFGAPKSYAVYIWTNKNLFWVTQYDGSTTLDSAPRNPTVCEPYMPGGS